jgi:RNA polymerase sigma-70 factor (ECF subfamily)
VGPVEASDPAKGGSVPADDDAADARRVLAGDADAFEGIVRRWQRPLVNLAYRFSRDHGLAEDMAQEAFLKAYRSLASWRGESRFSTWLFAVALNLYRSRVRRVEPAFIGLEDVELADERMPGDELDRREREEALRRTVLRLPPKYRDALILFYYHDMDVAQAAAALRVPSGTLKARLSRGRELLRKRLNRPGVRVRDTGEA